VFKNAFFIASLSVALLSGCSVVPKSSEPSLDYPSPPAQYTKGELNGETVFDILVAEMAGHQRRFDIALDKYLKQADLTGDPEIIRRATRIAQFSKDQASLEEAARIWAKHESNSPEPQELLAGLYIHQGRFDDAIPYINQALNQQGRQILFLLNTQARAMSPEVAQQFAAPVQQHLAASANEPDTWMTLGILQRQARQNEAALASFNQALRYKPSFTEASVQKADLLRDMGKTQQSLAILDQLLKKDPDNKQLSLLKIQSLYKADRPKPAVKLSQTLIENQADDEQLHLYLALLALDYNQLDDSQKMLLDVVRHGTNTAPFFYLGLIAEQQDRNEDAIRQYLKVSEGKNVLQAYTRAAALMDTDDDQERLTLALEEGINQHPSLAPDLIQLQADWLRQHGRLSDAIHILNQGIELYPEDLGLRYMRGMILPQEQFPLAETDFKFIIDQDPDNAMALNAYGYTLVIYTNRYEEAYQLLDRAIKLKPEEPAIIDSLGWVLYKLNRLDEAEAYLKKAFALYRDPEVGSHLVTVLAAQNKWPEAKALFTALQSEFPGDPHLSSAQDALQGH
jgi:tetratricopeptide (TPR) repeat protein